MKLKFLLTSLCANAVFFLLVYFIIEKQKKDFQFLFLLEAKRSIIFENGEPKLPLCKNIFDIAEGKWILRNDLKNHDFEERRRIDEETRLSMGWPRLLFRNDSR